MRVTREELLRIIGEQGEGIVIRELLRLCKVDRTERQGFRHLLSRLVDSGELTVMRGQRYILAGRMAAVTGRLSMHRDGYGFVTPQDGGSDIFMPARALRDNMHGDLVEVSVSPAAHGERREGRIVRTLERGQQTIVGRYESARNVGRVIADDPRISQAIVIPAGAAGKAQNGQVVVVGLTSYPTERRPAMGRIQEVLGWPDDPNVEVLTVVRKYELPSEFPHDALAEAKKVARLTDADLAGRTDLRGLTVVTIDGETARDFDDAVSVRRELHGDIRLWVSIADVSHYVRPGSALDREAYLRGTSVYFPDRCLPMLPETLSNGICSLNPREDRLTLTAELLFDGAGARKEALFYPSVIRSSARLTYTQVAQVLDERNPQVIGELGGIAADLAIMEELARRLMARRHERGSIDFDLPEPEIVIDLTTGDTLSIVRSVRTIAHRVIEEFMLAANEAVAGHLEGNQIPSLYRIHEPPAPERVLAFAELAAGFGHQLDVSEGKVTGTQLQVLLEAALGRPEELMLNRVLLRSMKQARYAAENLGHFGLAAQTYTHFTSPIRRYPDLVVHRILKGQLAGTLSLAEQERLAGALPEIGMHTSRRERVAMEAERELVELKRLQFMVDRIGEAFDGFIIGVTGSGLFVELGEFFVEGMIPVTSLQDDYYVYLDKQHSLIGSNTRRLFRIGDRVRVMVVAVSIDRRQIEFSLQEHTPVQQTDAGWEMEIPKPRRPVGRRPAGNRSGGDRKQTGGGGPKGKNGGRRKGGKRR